ncbi:YceI family protein [Sungkyunkwania multivorans]|uniref:YceI family protein n=1 Tax=Sungkyunkwania multivorans TaxID=1173618 RepID=A0ABW3CZ53_9FLAO
MKNTIIFLLLASSGMVFSQGKYLTKNGTINFEASVPSFEEVKAKNESVTAILNTENGEMAALALIKGFRFKVALMEEHFNENYIESSKFPKATFKGTLESFEFDNLQSEYLLNGSITLHGKTKDISTKMKLEEKGDQLVVSGSFVLRPEDFDIEIPKIVSNKIAEEVNVNVNFLLKRK